MNYDIDFFQNYVNDNDINSPKEFKIKNKYLYGKLVNLHLAKEICYKNKKVSYKNISTKEDYQEFINTNNIVSTTEFRNKYNSLYQKALKRGFYHELEFDVKHFWRKLNNFSKIEHFQEFIDNNRILSPSDFKSFDGAIYKKACNLGFANLLRYDKRNFSKSEIDILKLLSDNNINYIIQHKFDWLKSDKGYQMSLDFYLPEYNIAIECQGKQHFMPNDYFGGIDRYYDEIARNHKKHELCNKHNIKILYYVDLTLEDYKDVTFDNYIGKIYHDKNLILNDIFMDIVEK